MLAAGYESGVRLQEVFAACAKQSRHGRPSRRRRGYQVNRTLVVPNPQIRRTIQDDENAAQEILVNLGRAEADLIPGSQRIQRQENRPVVRARKKERPTVRSRLVAEKRRGENGSRR